MFSNRKIPHARVLRDDGGADRVALPGRPHGFDSVPYQDDLHKGKIVCPGCDAKLHFNRGSGVIGGGALHGPGPHFKTSPGQQHDSHCSYIVEPSDGDDTNFDPSLGFRIHINTNSFVTQFNSNSGLYRRDSRGRIHLRDPRLAGREAVSVKSADDIVRIMRNADLNRIRDSLIVHGRHVVQWSDFLVAYPKTKEPADRFRNLYNRLRNHVARGGLPVLMECLVTGPAVRSVRDSTAQVKSKAIFLDRTEHGTEFITPRVYLDAGRGAGWPLLSMMDEPGLYLVLGYARLKTHRNRDSVFHAINMSVTDPAQIVRADVRNLRPRPAAP